MVDEYTERFWSFLRGLRTIDEQEWPATIPTNTTDGHWRFYFNGEPLFPTALTPAHEKRKSGHASNLIIAMQRR